MKTLKTLVTDAKGNAIENLQQVYSSLQEAKLALVGKQSVEPGCKMRVWKSKQDQWTEMPWKILS